MKKENLVKKKIGRPPGSTSPDSKMLKELKSINKVLTEIRDILNNMWRERSPQ